jgi:hydrogenase maturation protease
MNRPENIVVMGIGNLLCADDGIGIHAVRELSDRGLPAKTVDAGTAILHALPFAEEATHLLVIDAVQGGGPPGSLYELDGYTMASASGQQSLHAMGLKQAMKLSPSERRPDIFKVLGVEPASVEYGMELSDPVGATLPEVVERASRVVAGWISSGDET